MKNRFQPRLAPRPVDPILRRLCALSPLAESEQALVRGLAERRDRHLAGVELVSEGSPPRRGLFVISGWACWQRIMPDGRRQIFRLVLPGDGIALGERPVQPAMASVVALTALETVDAEPVLEAILADKAAGLKQAMEKSRRDDQRMLLDHVVRLGRQTAYERVAHFLLELRDRLEVAGLGDQQRFPLPLTQEILADALGLSIVHVNRTLQQLRREHLIELRSGVAILLQPDVLADISGYQRPVEKRA